MTEGYVRFSAARNETRAPELSRVTGRFGELTRARTRLYDIGLIGMTGEGVGFGNISMRTAPGDRFLISGSATGGKRVLEPGGWCEILSFDLALNAVRYNGLIPPSSESMSHGAVYRSLPGAMYVIHIHHPGIFEYMLSREFLRTPAEAEYGTPAMAQAIAGAVSAEAAGGGGDEGVLVMAGHREGVLAYGEALRAVVRRLEELLVAAAR